MQLFALTGVRPRHHHQVSRGLSEVVSKPSCLSRDAYVSQWRIGAEQTGHSGRGVGQRAGGVALRLPAHLCRPRPVRLLFSVLMLAGPIRAGRRILLGPLLGTMPLHMQKNLPSLAA